LDTAGSIWLDETTLWTPISSGEWGDTLPLEVQYGRDLAGNVTNPYFDLFTLALPEDPPGEDGEATNPEAPVLPGPHRPAAPMPPTGHVQGSGKPVNSVTAPATGGELAYTGASSAMTAGMAVGLLALGLVLLALRRRWTQSSQA
jgi:LPXTG-motif cell wall-anchored protein